MSVKTTWTLDGDDSFTYTTAQYNTDPIPTWITEDYDNFLISGTAPTVGVDTTFNFIIETEDSTWYGAVEKQVSIILSNSLGHNKCLHNFLYCP